MQLNSLIYYPVKSMRGIHVHTRTATMQGLCGDREWLLSTPDGVFITARTVPQLLQWQALADEHGMTLTAPDGERLYIHRPSSHNNATVKVWHDVFCAHPCHDEAATWLSHKIGQPCRLHYLGNSSRILSHNQQPLSFADGAPYLLTSTASLVKLNQQLTTPIGMDRFRANIVIDGHTPYEEDHWHHIRIGSVEFELIRPSSRCIITTLDPQTSIPSALAEPLRTLAQTHRLAEGVCFGMNMVALNTGTITVGDAVTVLA